MHSMTDLQALPRDFFARDTLVVARELLGKLLVRRIGTTQRIGRIVEVEAYTGPHDLAAHSSKGLTPRTAVMHGDPGHAYVYLIYGIHHCMNVVTEPAGKPCAVLLRALEPVEGIDANTRGPGLLCKAMDIDLRCNRKDLCGDELFVADDGRQPATILATPRIGVAYAGEWALAPYRFLDADSAWVSGKNYRAVSAPGRRKSR
ncbi:MAG: 3-methyladenine glycosylase [Paucimonas sp.]|jgi:DNA-3-methyladenine glycosylase|nr:3-methyladenine glycosylase [Paucimonas sp.]